MFSDQYLEKEENTKIMVSHCLILDGYVFSNERMVIFFRKLNVTQWTYLNQCKRKGLLLYPFSSDLYLLCVYACMYEFM